MNPLETSPQELRRLLQRASELAADVQEAVAAGILTEHPNDPDLAFRHLLIQQALYESMPAALRTALHAEAARELAAVMQLTLSEADAIVRFRERNGPFKEWRDLTKVEGVDKSKIEARKDQLTF